MKEFNAIIGACVIVFVTLLLVSCVYGFIIWGCWDVAIALIPSLPVLTLWQSIKLSWLAHSLVTLNTVSKKD